MKKIWFVLMIVVAGCSNNGKNALQSDRNPVSAAVKILNNRAVITINGEPKSPLIYSLTDCPGGRWTWEEIPAHNIKVFNDHGFDLYQVDIFLDHVWFPDGSFSVDMARKQLRGIMDIDPDASVFFRLHVNAPKWWIKKHPEECIKYYTKKAVPDVEYGMWKLISNDAGLPLRFSLASEKWIEEASEKVEMFCNELAQTPEGNVLAGIQVACGIYGEWHYFGFTQSRGDYSKPMTDHFRAWLRNKYKTDDVLQQAWKDTEVTFESAMVPGHDVMDKASAGIFRHPQKDAQAIDYFKCQQELIADNIIHFSKTIKENWPRPIITGSFYGYFFSMFGRQAAGGHLCIDKVLNSKYVDYVCAPNAYYPNAEKPGDPYRSRGILLSAKLNGKLWLDEMDKEPHWCYPYSDEIDKVMNKNAALVKRNMMYTASKGMGLWFYDFGVSGSLANQDVPSVPYDHGWWDHPLMMQNIENTKQVLDDKIDKPYKSDADVLMVFDTDIFYYLRNTYVMNFGKLMHSSWKPKEALKQIWDEKDPVSHLATDWTSLAAFRTGAAVDFIYLKDLDLVDLDQYKMIVFTNTFRLTSAQKELIKNKVAKDNRHLMWTYAPGYMDEKSIDQRFIEDVTGMKMDKVNLSAAPVIKLNPEVMRSVPFQFGQAGFSPFFKVKDEECKSLATLNGTNNTIMAMKEFNDHTSWFVAWPVVHPEVLQYVFKQSGVHLYIADSDIVYAGNGIITLHTKKGGTRRVTLRNGKNVDVQLKNGPATVLIDNKTGEILDQN